jgi:hypothetical protein
LRIERFGIQPPQRLLLGVAHSQGITSLLPLPASTIGGRPYGKKVGAKERG